MPRFYEISHLTQYRYSEPVREAVMEIFKQPRSQDHQQLRSFKITIDPHCQLFAYADACGNAVYHFDLPDAHTELAIRTEGVVEIQPLPDLPDALPEDAWEALPALAKAPDDWEMLQPSRFVAPSDALAGFIEAHGIAPAKDPLTSLRALNQAIYEALDYVPDSTHAHSPIDEALAARAGVCQDFAHIMATIARGWGIPCRYVSGYLYTEGGGHDRSRPDASHAWVEAALPGLGWVGFDPTNDTLACDRHIRVAVGRDYADVPPTRGVFKGNAESELSVAVSVAETGKPRRHEEFLRIVRPMPHRHAPTEPDGPAQQAQAQQQ